ncbi:Protein kinase domain-containing protein 20 [Elsinoe fawcettii]|nr:Protein kinase domain-containing protein 20 [Elsinoe fawcettii]
MVVCFLEPLQKTKAEETPTKTRWVCPAKVYGKSRTMTDPNPDQPPAQRSDEQTPALSPSGSDVTPRVEKPLIIATEPTPLNTEPPTKDGFFAVNSQEAHQPRHVDPPDQRSPTPSIASSGSSSRLRDAVLDVARRMSAQIDLGSSTRPTVQRDLSHASAASTESTDSTATITPTSPRAARQTVTFGPAPFPNQAFSALHHQQYPAPHLPPALRTPGLYSQFPTSNNLPPSHHISGTRTHDHSPAVTPGLFNPSPVRSSSGTPVTESSYSSPYLHHLHTQVPKETHVADIDVDPISGRKLINDYEIIDELGRGTHGKVKLGRSLTTGDFVAIKIVERFPKKRRLGRLGNAEDKVKREVAILKKARHPHIVALLEVIDDPARRKVYIVLERVDMGEIPWRQSGPKEICLVEYRRYERESKGIFDDEEADREDRAIVSLCRVRRVKSARARYREIKRAHHVDEDDEAHWSIELAPDVDEESEFDSASRSGSYVDSHGSPELDRILSRSTERLHRTETSDLLATVTPDTNRQSAEDERLASALSGTMFGAFEDPMSPPEDETPHAETMDLEAARKELPRLEQVITEEEANTDIRRLTRDLSHDNLAQRAADLLEIDIHPDLMYVPCMTIQAARESFRDTLLGLQYLHYQGIIHRDIKPPNLLQTRDYRTKISDFGVSYLGRPMEDGDPEESETDHDFDEAKELAKNVGTAAFYAPELCFTDTEENHPPIGKAIDVWALGVTLFCMIFARVPFVDSEWIVMRRIAEEEVYIPSKRLRPVDTKPQSRGSSQNRQWNKYSAFRNGHSLEYEEVPEDLIDLLRRLLTKDVRYRISLEGVRHHPWVTGDLPDREGWLETSNPANQAEGKKIEVSREDVETSVVPITIMDKIKSSLLKAAGSVGLGRSASTKRRNASQDGSGASASSSASNMHAELRENLRDLRRKSLRGDEPILQALKLSREHDHPLAKSLTVSPVSTPHQQRISNTTSLGTPRSDANSLTPTQTRTAKKDAHDPAVSMMSTTASARTIRPSDGQPAGYFDTSPPTSPTLPMHSDTSGQERFSGLLGSAIRSIKSVRDRSATGRSDDKSSVVSTRSSDAEPIHGEPVVAVNTTSATGQLNPPRALKDFTPASSKPVSPTVSRQSSLVTTPDFSVKQGAFDDFRSSKGSPSAIHTGRHILPEHKPPTPQTRPASRLNESTDQEYQRAEDELLRRQIAEGLSKQSVSPTTSQHDTDACPPSPDDDLFSDQSKHHGTSIDSMPPSLVPSVETGPASPSSSVMPLITPVSSEDRIKTRPTPATSTPSIPSVIDEDQHDVKEKTPVTDQKAFPAEHDATFTHAADQAEHDGNVSSFDAEHHLGVIPQSHDDEGYHADTAIDSDEDQYDDSSDDDGGLQMMRRKSIPPPVAPQRSTSVNVAVLSRHRERRETGGSNISKKSERSGSGGTMRKVKPAEVKSDPEDGRGERKISAALTEE